MSEPFRVALIKDGLVDNIIVVQSMAKYQPPDGFGAVRITKATKEAHEGATWDGDRFGPRPEADAPPPPTIVSMFQFRAALIDAGLFERADEGMKGHADPMVPTGWDYRVNVRRGDIVSASVQKLVEADDDAWDDLFRSAAAIED